MAEKVQKPKFPKEIRLVLVGKTGVGKSALGNSLLGGNYFKSVLSPESVTETCESHSKGLEIGGNKCAIKIIDTPGVFDTKKSTSETMTELLNCVLESEPGVHVFLIVISLRTRFGEEEKKTLDMFMDNFGEETEKFVLVVFTGKDCLNGHSIEKWIAKSPAVLNLTKKYNNRYCAIDNTDHNSEKTALDVENVFNMVLEIVSQNSFSIYDQGLFQAARTIYAKRVENEKKRLEEEKMKEIENIKENFLKELNIEERILLGVEKKQNEKIEKLQGTINSLNDTIERLQTENNQLQTFPSIARGLGTEGIKIEKQENLMQLKIDILSLMDQYDDPVKQIQAVRQYVESSGNFSVPYLHHCSHIRGNYPNREEIFSVNQHTAGIIDKTENENPRRNKGILANQYNRYENKLIGVSKNEHGYYNDSHSVHLGQKSQNVNQRDEITIPEHQYLESGNNFHEVTNFEQIPTDSDRIQIPLIDARLKSPRNKATKRKRGRMPEPGYGIIRKHYETLIDEIQPDKLANSLFSKFVFDDDDLDKIKVQQPEGRKKMTEELLLCLLQCGDSFDQFIDSLDETGHDTSYLIENLAKPMERKYVMSKSQQLKMYSDNNGSTFSSNKKRSGDESETEIKKVVTDTYITNSLSKDNGKEESGSKYELPRGNGTAETNVLPYAEKEVANTGEVNTVNVLSTKGSNGQNQQEPFQEELKLIDLPPYPQSPELDLKELKSGDTEAIVDTVKKWSKLRDDWQYNTLKEWCHTIGNWIKNNQYRSKRGLELAVVKWLEFVERCVNLGMGWVEWREKLVEFLEELSKYDDDVIRSVTSGNKWLKATCENRHEIKEKIRTAKVLIERWRIRDKLRFNKLKDNLTEKNTNCAWHLQEKIDWTSGIGGIGIVRIKCEDVITDVRNARKRLSQRDKN